MQKRLSTLFLVCLTLMQCGWGANGEGNALLSLLVNRRMIVMLKGTYATDSPLAFSELNNNQLFRDADDSVNVDNIPAYSDLPIYIDFGEIRLSSKFGTPILISNNDDAVAFWDVLTSGRQVYCSQIYSFDPLNDRCLSTGGLINFRDFMNGNGAIYPSRDVGPGIYPHAGVFVRAIATGYSKDDATVSIDRFDNNDIFGHNIIQNVNYDPGVDAAQKQILLPQFFPLLHPSHAPGYLVVDDSYQPIILEIRFNLKENLMVHSYPNGSSRTQTIVSFSDWRKNHAGQFDIGGAVLTRARMIYPGYASSLTITGGVETTPNRFYYALYFQVEEKKDETLPIAATPVRNGSNVLANIMPGISTYLLQCRYDCKYDGYPEVVVTETPFEMQLGPRTVDLACGNAVPAGCD